MVERKHGLILLALTLAMLLVAVGCGKHGAGAQETKPVDPLEEALDPDTIRGVLSTFEDVDYNEYTFTQWVTPNDLNQFITMRQAPEDEKIGDVVNDALWTRDRAVEDKFNITIDYFVVDSNMVDQVQKVIKAGDDEIGLVYLNMVADAPALVMSGACLDMASIEQIDLTHPCWSQNALQDLAIDGMIYYATGDITTRYAGAPYILLFNKALFDERNFVYPYQDVRDKTWTFDKMNTLVAGQYMDKNGNSRRDEGDIFGYAYESGMQGFAFYNGFGYRAVEFDGTDPIIRLAEESHINAIERLAKFAALPDVWLDQGWYQETEIFTEDRALFCGQTACNLYMLTNMENDFGVLPLPKESEEQKAYYSYSNLNCATSVHIPKSTHDLERTGTIVQALAEASRVSSMRAQYEVTLKYRFTRDRESVEMLQIATENAIYDPANLYDLGDLYGLINMGSDSGIPLASSIRSVRRVIPRQVELLLDKMYEN